MCGKYCPLYGPFFLHPTDNEVGRQNVAAPFGIGFVTSSSVPQSFEPGPRYVFFPILSPTSYLV